MNKLKFDAETSNDDEFFGDLERARNNLDQLFGVGAQLESEQQQHHTLKYTPPKQPATNTSADAPHTPRQQQWTTVLAKVANSFKEGESMGRVGVALLRNPTGAAKMIIYKTKANILASLTLNTAGDSGQLHRQSGYLQFYDDELHAWSLRFEKEPDEDEFLKKLHDLGVRIQEKLEVIKEPRSNSVEEVPQTIVIKSPTSQTDKSTQERTKEASKTKLITRMAKVGQQLPALAGTAPPEHQNSDFSDSSDTELLVTPSAKPKIPPRGAALQPKAQILAAQMSAYNAAAAASMSLSAGSSGVSVGGTPMESQFLQMLLTENRTQNTEVRLNINKLESKMEKVLDRIEGLHSGANHRSHNEDELLELEEKLLALKKENRRLKHALEAKQSPSPPPPPQHSEEKLLQSILKTHHREFAALGVVITAEQSDLKSIVRALIEKTETMQHKCDTAEALTAVTSIKLKSHEQLLREEQEKHAEIVAQVHDLEEAIKSLQEALKTKDQDYSELQQQLAEKIKFYATQAELEKQRNESTVKAIMNNLYRNLVGKIENVSPLHKPDILALIGRTIRTETLRAIEQVKEQ